MEFAWPPDVMLFASVFKHPAVLGSFQRRFNFFKVENHFLVSKRIGTLQFYILGFLTHAKEMAHFPVGNSWILQNIIFIGKVQSIITG